jgi:hypothetical protein
MRVRDYMSGLTRRADALPLAGESQFVNATVGFIDSAGIVAAVIDTLLVHVGDVNVTVGTSFDINRPKPGIIRLEHSFNVFRFERRLIRLEVLRTTCPCSGSMPNNSPRNRSGRVFSS